MIGFVCLTISFLCFNLVLEYRIQLPDQTSYVDIINCSQIPNVTLESLKSYLQANDKTFDDKCKQLYEQRYMRLLRVSHFQNLYYVASVVWAEMKKQTSYKVDVSLDEHGIVSEAQCECGAGQGPTAHCKHVTTVLYALFRLRVDGTVLTEQTCTQVLQTFHRTKPYTGSPMTSADIHDMRNHHYIFDPRPTDRINHPGYPSHFRNTILGFQSEDRMPVTQLFKPANPHSLKDHHYTDKSEEEAFLEREKITSMSETERINLERLTVGQHTNATWNKQHTLRITSSQFGVICKATSRKDLGRLADQLVSPRPFSSRAVQHGLKYEAIAVQQFESLYGPTEPSGMFTCADTPWLAASPDRIVSDAALLEVKCPFAAKDKFISPATVPYLKKVGDDLQLDTKHVYYYQIQGQLLCSDRDLCYFCVYTHKDMRVVKIQKDRSFIAEMLPHLQQFWTDYFQPAVLRRYVYRYYDRYFWDSSQ